jgi:hypothetical protein
MLEVSDDMRDENDGSEEKKVGTVFVVTKAYRVDDIKSTRPLLVL